MTPEERRHKARAYDWRRTHGSAYLASREARTFNVQFPGLTCGGCNRELVLGVLVRQEVGGKTFHHATKFVSCWGRYVEDELRRHSLEVTKEAQAPFGRNSVVDSHDG